MRKLVKSNKNHFVKRSVKSVNNTDILPKTVADLDALKTPVPGFTCFIDKNCRIISIKTPKYKT